MALESNDLRRMLDDAYDDSIAQSLTLREKLRANERAAGSLVSGGSLSSISQSSSSHSYAFGRGNITPADLARGWRTLIDCYDTILATASVTTDAAIKAEMLLRLQPVNDFTKDFAGLHCV